MSLNPQLTKRPRRLRATAAIRGLVRETQLRHEDLILPLFVSEKISARAPVKSMPGVFQFSFDETIAEAAEAVRDGIRSVLIFGIPAEKDERAAQAYAEDGIVQRTVRALKRELPELVVITDVCLCEYMSHGHCGIADRERGQILNDASLELLAKSAVSHALAGADMVAPSDMMDGRVGAIRAALEAAGCTETSHDELRREILRRLFTGRSATPRKARRNSATAGPIKWIAANAAEALREVALDLEEGADIVMVKPGLPYLDVLWRVKERFQIPTAIYNVSGEYAMVKAAAQNGWIDERAVVMETMTAFKRAGADLIATYWARDVARWLS